MIGGCIDARGPEATRAERIERTRVALEAVLFPEAAAREAVRYVDMCETSPLEMLMEEKQSAWDPDGPELFASLEEAVFSGDFLGGRGIPLSGLACTEAGREDVMNVQNV